MNRLKRLPIKFFLPLIVLMFFILMFIFMMTYQYHAQISNLERYSMENIKQKLSSLQSELEEDFSENNFQQGNRAVSAFGLIHEVRSLAIIDENNDILLATKYDWKTEQAENIIPDFDVNINNKVKLEQSSITFLTPDHLSIKGYYPVKLFKNSRLLGTTSIGVIFLDYDLTMAHTRILNRKITEGGIFSVIGLLFMGLLIYLLNVLVGRPLQHLSETTHRLANGELGIQLNKYGQGELATLATVFNKMSTQIEENITQIRRNERHLSMTLDSIGDAVIVTNSLGQITRINPASSKLTGWPIEEAIGKKLSEVFNIINSITREPVTNPVIKVLQTKCVVELADNTALLSRDGSEFQIADSAAPIVGSTGKISGVVLVFRNVTSEYALQSALRKSEMRFRNLVETTSDWIWEVDSKGYYTYASPHCLTVLGYEPNELLGKTPFDFMPANEAERVKAIFLSVSKEKQTFTNLENLNLHKQGYQIVLETSGVPFFSFNGELLGYTAKPYRT